MRNSYFCYFFRRIGLSNLKCRIAVIDSPKNDTDNSFAITKITLIDTKNKIEGIKDKFPNAKVIISQIDSNKKVKNPEPSGTEKTNDATQSVTTLAVSDYANRVPVSGYSQFGAIQEIYGNISCGTK